MKINVYLSFPGTCEEALEFYHEVLGGELMPMRYFEGSTAEPSAPPGWGKKVMHGALAVGDIHLMGSDLLPQHFEAPRGVHLSVNTESIVEAERVFETLADDGKVIMPLEEAFWAKRFGMLTDRYGIHWMVSYAQPDLPGRGPATK